MARWGWIPGPKSGKNEQSAGDSETGRRPGKYKRAGNRPQRLVRRMLGALAAFLAGGFLALAGLFGYYGRDLPDLAPLIQYSPPTVSVLYSDDGRIIAEYGEQRRFVAPLETIPLHVRKAFMAAEDARFYDHGFLDPKGLVRALIRNVEAGRLNQGASTITQQLVRCALLTHKRTIDRKVREIILAWQLENRLSKDEILHRYLNHVYLGQGAYGVEAAALEYYGKHVQDITMAEAALLAGLVQAPSESSPARFPGRARRRQVYTLGQMLEKKFITPGQYQAALAEPITIIPRVNPAHTAAPWFAEHVRRFLEARYGADRLYREGLRVHTTVNLDLTDKAEKSVAGGLWDYGRRLAYEGPEERLDPDQARRFLQEQTETLRRSPLVPHQETWALVTEAGPGKTGLKVAVGPYEGAIAGTNLHPGLKKAGTSGLFQPGDKIWVKALGQNPATGQWTLALGQHRNAQAALVCLDPGTGEIKAMVGGREEGSGGFNRAVQSRRQPGSAFKPIIYTAAMENGFSPESILIDAPVVHNLFGQGLRWKPMNYDGQFHGPTDLYTGLVESRNIIAIKLLEEVGVDRTIECARRLGITSDLASNPTLALGSSGVSLLEMVQAYAVFPGQGKRPEPLFVTRVEDREGRLIDAFGPSRTQAVEPATAAVMTWMLKGVVENGTGGRIRALGRPCGGKTGTTNDRADAWFVGFTPEYVTGVWVGRDDLTPLGPGESGARAAAPIFLEYMRAALAGRPVRDFSLPSDVRLVDLGNRRVLVRDNQAAALAFRPSPAVDELEKEM